MGYEVDWFKLDWSDGVRGGLDWIGVSWCCGGADLIRDRLATTTAWQSCRTRPLAGEQRLVLMLPVPKATTSYPAAGQGGENRVIG